MEKVRESLDNYFSSISPDLVEKFNTFLLHVADSYDKPELVEAMRKDCPICNGRQKLPPPHNLECPCKELFSKVLYFKLLLNHTKDSKAVPPIDIHDVPRIVLFQSNLPNESYITFMFYLLVKLNFYGRRKVRRKICRRSIEDIITFSKEASSNPFPEALSYMYLNNLYIASPTQGQFMDGVLTNFVISQYAKGKSVWIYNSLKPNYKFPRLVEQIQAIGQVVTWDSNITATKTTPTKGKVPKGELI